MLAFIKRRKILVSTIVVIVLAVAGWAIFGRNGGVPSFETAVVERGSVVRIVSETGIVSAADEVDLAFTTSGRITSVLVNKGDRVAAGRVLARLDSTQAEAALRAAEARASAAGAARSQGAQQQDQLVENARLSLLRDDLQAYLSGTSPVEGSNWSYVPPRITGTYSCDREGEYRITLYASGAPSGYSFRVSGLENLQAGTVSASQPQPLGSCGLFIQFPENFVRGSDIIWSIPIPNTRSATYASRLGAYQAALETRSLALSEERNAPVYAAEVEQARAALANTVLVAPFEGIITSLSATLGQIASPGAPVASLVSVGRFEITIEVPEDDIVGIDPGDRVEVVFDALRDVRLAGEVIYVAPAASRASGFAGFEVLVHLTGEDPQVRSGLTADVDIYADAREDVIAIPVRAVIEEDGGRFVRVMENETSYYRVPVIVGLRGGGMYEITGGLQGGERIITFANTAALDALTDLDVH